MKLKIVQLTTDNRSHLQQFERTVPWFGPAPEALFSGFAAFPSEVDLHIISCTRQPVQSPEKLADNIWFHSLVVPKIGWMRTGFQGCLRATRRCLKQIQPDLVHGQGSEGDAAICAAYSGYPNVITLLGILREMSALLHAKPGSYYWVAGLLESWALRRTAGVLANSRFTREKVRPRTRQTWLSPNAVREAFFKTPLPPPRPARCVLLNAGSVCSYKRQNELLDVAEQLHAEGLPFELHFLGGASQATPYGKKFLERVQNRPYLFHHGQKDLDDVIRLLDSSAALVHVSAIESFGLVVAEALSRNLKFIGFTSGGVADIVENVEGAEGFADGDWAGLKAAISRWVRAGHPRPTTAAAAIRQRYHPTEIARQHLEIYREVLGRR